MLLPGELTTHFSVFWYNDFFVLISFHSKLSVDCVIVLKRALLRMACCLRKLYIARTRNAPAAHFCLSSLIIQYNNKWMQVCSNYIIREEKVQCLLILLSSCCYIFSFINLYQYQLFLHLVDTATPLGPRP